MQRVVCNLFHGSPLTPPPTPPSANEGPGICLNLQNRAINKQFNREK